MWGDGAHGMSYPYGEKIKLPRRKLIGMKEGGQVGPPLLQGQRANAGCL